MASSMEIRIVQKNYLLQLIKLKKTIGESDALNNLIVETEAIMEAEDVAYIEKKAELLK